MRVGVLVGARGRGSNLEALVRGADGYAVAVALGTEAEAPALARAQGLGVPTRVVPYDEGFEAGVLAALREFGVGLLCLAGFLRRVPEGVIRAVPTLNVHPSLLPRHGGQGMYGMRVHRAVLEAGDAESGCTVHWVSAEYDEGEILVQRRVPVEPGDTPETLAARVLAAEHEAYPEAVRLALS